MFDGNDLNKSLKSLIRKPSDKINDLFQKIYIRIAYIKQICAKKCIKNKNLGLQRYNDNDIVMPDIYWSDERNVPVYDGKKKKFYGIESHRHMM